VGLDREGSIIAALIGLIVGGLVVSMGAWVLLRRERRRAPVGPPGEPEPIPAPDPDPDL
jgi:hypothetical protein